MVESNAMQPFFINSPVLELRQSELPKEICHLERDFKQRTTSNCKTDLSAKFLAIVRLYHRTRDAESNTSVRFRHKARPWYGSSNFWFGFYSLL